MHVRFTFGKITNAFWTHVRFETNKTFRTFARTMRRGKGPVPCWTIRPRYTAPTGGFHQPVSERERSSLMSSLARDTRLSVYTWPRPIQFHVDNMYLRAVAYTFCYKKRRRGGHLQSSQAIKLFHYYTLRQWFPNAQQSRFLTACRRLEKLVLPSIFDTSLLSLIRWNCGVIQQQFWMKEFDFFWGGGVETYSDPCYIFSGVNTSTPGSTPLPSPAVFPSLIAEKRSAGK